jgi:hypothetical protein
MNFFETKDYNEATAAHEAEPICVSILVCFGERTRKPYVSTLKTPLS